MGFVEPHGVFFALARPERKICRAEYRPATSVAESRPNREARLPIAISSSLVGTVDLRVDGKIDHFTNGYISNDNAVGWHWGQHEVPVHSIIVASA